MKSLWLIVTFVLLSFAHSNAESALKPNGGPKKVWIDFTQFEKQAYLMGFFDGVDLGSVEALVSIDDDAAYEKANAEYERLFGETVSTATARTRGLLDIAAAVDWVYSRQGSEDLWMVDAVWIGVLRFLGASDEKLFREILEKRVVE